MAIITLKVRWTLTKSYRQVPFEQTLTARQAIELVARKNKISNPQDYFVYVPPTEKSAGFWLDDNSTLGSANLRDRDTIELKLTPYNLNVCLTDGSAKWLTDFTAKPADKVIITLKVDFSDPLVEIVPTLERSDKIKPKEEYVFQHLSPSSEGYIAKWLNVNVSLHEQDVPRDGFVALHPISMLFRRSVESIRNPRIEGWLTKSSVKEGKQTNIKKRWCVLKDNFLFYFKSPTQSSPNGIVTLEYYNITPDKTDGKFQFELVPVGTSFSHSSTIYQLQMETEADYKEWLRAIRERSATGAGKKVFGVPLSKLLCRKDRTSDIPSIVEKTVRYLETNGLEVEGIFRISPGAASIEKYKDEFDLAVDVDLSRVSDPHTVAGLLKLYLRELPEPLLTFELYDNFIQSLNETGSKKQAKMKDLINLLPTANKKVLEFLLSFLRSVSQHSDKTLMGLQNLATVFGPNLLRPKADTVESLVHQTPSINAIIETLIEEQDEIFTRSNDDHSTFIAQPQHLSIHNPHREIQQRIAQAFAESQKANHLVSSDQMTITEYAIALYDYNAASDRELSFRKDDVMRIYQKLESGWLSGELNGITGMIPATYVRLSPTNPEVPPASSTSSASTSSFVPAQKPPSVNLSAARSSSGSFSKVKESNILGTRSPRGKSASGFVPANARDDEISLAALAEKLEEEVKARQTLENQLAEIIKRLTEESNQLCVLQEKIQRLERQ